MNKRLAVDDPYSQDYKKYTKYNWMRHLDLIEEKAIKVKYKLNRIATAIWGVKPQVFRSVYKAVAEHIVLHAASIWYSSEITLCRTLLSIQRGLLFSVTKCYSTVSTNA